MQASSKDRQRGGWKEQDHRVIVSNMENPFFFDIYKTIEAEAHTNGYERGLRVPEDVSVTGFDNVKLSEFCCPALTTVHIPRDTIGHLISETLISRSGKTAAADHEMIIDPDFVLRDSTGPAPGR